MDPASEKRRISKDEKGFFCRLALLMVLSVCTFASAEGKDYSGYTIRIYSNSNSTERATWLENAAKAAGFTISLDDNSVISAIPPPFRPPMRTRTATSSSA